MISARNPAASFFLVLSAVAFLVLYALPLLVAPLRWARAFRWRIPADGDLASYLGRCLGGVAAAICAIALRAAPRPEAHPWLFDLIALTGGILAGVHVLGAIRRTQPWTEDAEIPLYVALAALAAWFRFTLAPG